MKKQRRKLQKGKLTNTILFVYIIEAIFFILFTFPIFSSKFSWNNRFGLRSSTASPIANSTPTAVKKTTVSRMASTKIDPRIYLDTQSNGFASRVVRYHDESEAKTRISNQSYRRPGDFPIVNLNKAEINLNKRRENAPQISKINIVSPINLINQASERSAIFRTGKNYGETLSAPTANTLKSGKSLVTPSSQDEPIFPINNDYENSGSARSSLDALKEISRKRIHCDVS